ncbi:acyl-CoA dehydrogenase family protein [bacterium]|nr:acyl-CoA dehydrogenase family protein [bacterium]
MENFFKDNQDILFYFEHGNLEDIASRQEYNFADAENFDYAPQNAKDAVDSYYRVLEEVGDISANYIAPRSEDIDRQGNTYKNGEVHLAPGMKECIDRLAKADLMGFTLPRKFGGLNFPTLIYTMSIEIVSRADAGLMNIFGLQGIAETINAFASEEIKQEYLPRFSSGEVTGSMALTEPDAGSDLQNVSLRATQLEDGSWVLNGVKRFITNGCGQVSLILTRTEEGEKGGLGLSLHLYERDKTMKIRRIEEKLGIHGSPTCELQFNNSPALLIGERRRGLVTYVMALMNGARLGIAAQSLGIAQAAYIEARKYAASRKQFGVSIDKLPAVADMLTEMQIKIEASRALTYEASKIVDYVLGFHRKMKDANTDPDEKKQLKRTAKKLDRLASFLTPCSKYLCSEMCILVTYDALQVLGGSGYMQDYPVERLYRDARITTIYEGTSQLQVVAAMRGVLSGLAEKRFVELADMDYSQTDSSYLKILEQSRKYLADAIDYLKSQNKSALIDLHARKLVDIAIDIYIGYLFLGQAQHSDRKKIVADRYIKTTTEKIKMNFSIIKSGEQSTLDNFDELLGAVPEMN